MIKAVQQKAAIQVNSSFVRLVFIFSKRLHLLLKLSVAYYIVGRS